MFYHDEHFIYFKCDKKQAEKLNATFVKSKGLYKLPITLGAIRELYQIMPNEKLLEIGQELKSKLDKVKELKKRVDCEGDERLRPYQRVDVDFLSQIEHIGIFNEQRTGKTVITSKLIEPFQKVLIVCPSSLKLNWKIEIEDWIGRESVILEGSKKKREELINLFNKDVIKTMIVSYETLRNDVDLIKSKIDCLVVDEAHRLKNPQTKQSKALNKVAKTVIKRIALTGTPALNHSSDIFGILQFLYPKNFTSKWQFIERYFKVNDGHFGKSIGRVKRESELKEMLEMFSTNRKRKEVMKWLPKVSKRVIKLEGDKKQMKAYKEMLETFEIEVEGEIISDAISPLAQLTRLRQLTVDPNLIGVKTKSAKEEFILDYISDNPDESIIIFSTFTSYLKELKEKIKGSVAIFGDMTTEQKQKSVNDFQKGKTNIILANIKSGGVGFTLDRAETTIFIDRDFVPVINQQASDRFVPTKQGEHDPKTIIDLVIKDTVDEKIIEMLEDKRNIIEIVNNYGLGVLIR